MQAVCIDPMYTIYIHIYNVGCMCGALEGTQMPLNAFKHRRRAAVGAVYDNVWNIPCHSN